MSKPLLDGIPFAKIITVLAIAFGIGLGLCGLDAALLGGLRSPANEFGPNTIVGGIGAFAMLLSAAALVVTIFIWVVTVVVGSFSHKNSEPQRLLDEKDETDGKDSR